MVLKNKQSRYFNVSINYKRFQSMAIKNHYQINMAQEENFIPPKFILDIQTLKVHTSYHRRCRTSHKKIYNFW